MTEISRSIVTVEKDSLVKLSQAFSLLKLLASLLIISRCCHSLALQKINKQNALSIQNSVTTTFTPDFLLLLLSRPLVAIALIVLCVQDHTGKDTFISCYNSSNKCFRILIKNSALVCSQYVCKGFGTHLVESWLSFFNQNCIS